MTEIDDLLENNTPIPRPEPVTRSYSSPAVDPLADLRRRHGPNDPVERAKWLMDKAEALERSANQTEGTCFVGGVSLSASRRSEAALLREQATLLLKKAKRP